MTPPSPEQLERLRTEAITADVGDSAVIATDVDGTIAYWNAAAAELYGWTHDEVVGRNILDVTPTRNSSDDAGHIMEQLRHGRSWTGTFIARRRDGMPIMVRVTDLPVREGGRVIGVIGISRAERRSGGTPIEPPPPDRAL